eukprot:scaffold3504_cov240-Pinguiococcus_pyrenoidosus.AAC.68
MILIGSPVVTKSSSFSGPGCPPVTSCTPVQIWVVAAGELSYSSQLNSRGSRGPRSSVSRVPHATTAYEV